MEPLQPILKPGNAGSPVGNLQPIVWWLFSKEAFRAPPPLSPPAGSGQRALLERSQVEHASQLFGTATLSLVQILHVKEGLSARQGVGDATMAEKINALLAGLARARESAAPDPPKGELLVRSDIVLNAPVSSIINLTVPSAPQVTASELEEVAGLVSPRLGDIADIAMASLSNAQVDLLARDTGRPAEQVRALVDQVQTQEDPITADARQTAPWPQRLSDDLLAPAASLSTFASNRRGKLTFRSWSPTVGGGNQSVEISTPKSQTSKHQQSSTM